MDINFISTTRGWATGYSGVILSTTNGGSTWVSQASGNTNNLWSISPISETQACMVGSGKKIVTTANGGTNWTLRSTSVSYTSLNSSSFVSATQGWAVGDYGTIINTNDGGKTWATQTSGVSIRLNKVCFASATKGWAVGASGTILYTSNGGASWTKQTSGTTNYLNAVHFVSETTGWAVGNSIILKTTNGGATWSTISTGSFSTWYYGVKFISANVGWVVGESNGGVILKTTNGGASWTTTNIGANKYLYDIDIASNGTDGWISGYPNIILKTSNAGSSWTAQATGLTNISLTSVRFLTTSTGWAVGSSGTLLATSNGGSTWTNQSTGSFVGLSSLSVYSGSKIWMFGGNGAIFSYDPTVILPLNFTGIKATQNNGAVNVEWTVSKEENVHHYEIERSVDGRSFNKTGSVLANSNNAFVNTYKWLDVMPVNGNNYYRVKSVDNDGAVKYSKVVTIALGKQSNISTYPNPVTGQSFTIQINNKPKGIYCIKLMNASGQEVYATQLNHNGETSSQNITPSAKLPKGYYTMIINNGLTTTSQKVLFE